MSKQLIPTLCPVCYNSVVAPVFNGGNQTLATLGWPASLAEAQSMPRYPQNFVQCPKCTHVWNYSFSYDAIPYESNPNRMFNKGEIWKGHLAATRDLVLARMPKLSTVVDIGCGEGHFLRGLSAARSGAGRFIGFDPNITPETGRGVEFYARYFSPLDDMAVYAPDVVVIRHVLEHLMNPAEFLDQLAWGAAQLGKPVWLFVETPCIDRVFETNRLADFFYEHRSHFTTRSLHTLVERAGEVVELAHGYDREVIYALVRLDIPLEMRQRVKSSIGFSRNAEVNRSNIQAQMEVLASSGKKIAIWGGTGKAASFIHQFKADSKRFPLVVDSDPDKAGTFVPATGQRIEFRDVLKKFPVDIVIIPTQWRARDIAKEMEEEGITPSQILIEHNGKLISLTEDEHPY